MSMNISAKITGINYKPFLQSSLSQVQLNDFDINSAPTSCLIIDGQKSFAISKWVSPKRTRSYPYERVYNTLGHGNKSITVIPIVKDEGFAGDRDFIQWDTISLMSLLNVFVIFGYYSQAEKHRSRANKITGQKFDNEYVLNKIAEIDNYHSSALHWNIGEIKRLSMIMDRVKESYARIAKKLKIKLHGAGGLESFQKQLSENATTFFKDSSRTRSQQARSRELQTRQPKEALATASKASITIVNYLGGEYFLTVDETKIENNILRLIESKHTNRSRLPSRNDIKDGLLKMMLFSNLTEFIADSSPVNHVPVLQLTSALLKGSVDSRSTENEIAKFNRRNKLNPLQQELIRSVFAGSKENRFEVILKFGKTKK